MELNAFASDELVAFIERKLDALGIKKVVPDDETLAQAAERARTKALINEKMEAIVEEASEQAKQMATITDLAASVRALLEKDRELSWDAAIARIVEGVDEEGE